MSTHDMNIANQAFPAFRADLNNALGALVSNSSSATEPTTTFAHQWWVDTSASPSVVKIRNLDNDAWVTIGTIDESTDTFTPSGVTADKIEEGNSKVEVVDSGTGYVTIVVDGSEQMRISASGAISTPNGLNFDSNTLVVDATNNRVGIGTASPATTLHVTGSQLRLQTDNCSHQFYNTAGSRYAYLEAQSSNLILDVESGGGGTFVVKTSGSERIRVNQYGLLFNGDTAAANALDDYEEGTWTPTVAGTTTAGTATYVSQQGTYLKVGGLVFFRCYLNWNSGTGTGNIRFNGLPFTCAGYTAVTIAYPYDFALSANKYLCNGYIEQSSTYFNALEASLGGGTVNAIPYDAAGEIMVSGCYRV
jgi:hypothetical protein